MWPSQSVCEGNESWIRKVNMKAKNSNLTASPLALLINNLA
jgi:hypothetical protein